jgi:curved DNA-binding protein
MVIKFHRTFLQDMPVEFKDYYKVLGVTRDASDEAIRKAFRSLARKHHPDVARDKKGAEERFKEINEAYEVLGDPAKRKRYDQLGAEWSQGMRPESPGGWPPHGRARGSRGPEEEFEFHFGGTGFSDFFEQFFGRGRSGEQPGFGTSRGGTDGDEDARPFSHQRGPDVQGEILVSLEEALHGSVRSVTLQRVHPHTGAVSSQTFKVRIPAGVSENQLIRVAGKGESGIGRGAAGDLYLRIRYAAHPDFRVRGSDLLHDLELAPWEAVLGTTLSVPSLDGPVSVRIPAGTSTGHQLRVRGRGIPQGKDGPRGDLFIVAQVQIPKSVDAEQRRLWEQLAAVSQFNPRQES